MEAKIRKKPSLIAAIGTTRTMRGEIKEKLGDTAPDYITAVDRLVDALTNPTDRELANLYLLIVGALLVALGVVCGAAGSWHAFHGNAQAAIIGKYAVGFFAGGWICFAGVQK